MGGYGSGRTFKVHKTRTKKFVTELPCLNSFTCMNRMLAENGNSSKIVVSSTKIVVSKDHLSVYRLSDKDSSKPLIRSPMQKVRGGFGVRYYFTCPMCKKRVSKLYLGYALGCRKCHNLVYPSQNMSNEDRWFLRRSRLLKRYKVTFEQASYGEKPKGMHHKTFEKVLLEFEYLNKLSYLIHLNRFEYKNCLAMIKKKLF